MRDALGLRIGCCPNEDHILQSGYVRLQPPYLRCRYEMLKGAMARGVLMLIFVGMEAA